MVARAILFVCRVGNVPTPKQVAARDVCTIRAAWLTGSYPMNAPHDSVIVPALHDTFTDARTGGAGMADEQPDDGWSRHRVDDPQYVADMQQREAALTLGYVDALCLACGCLL